MVDVRVNGKTYKMGHYSVDSTRPRPESYRFVFVYTKLDISEYNLPGFQFDAVMKLFFN